MGIKTEGKDTPMPPPPLLLVCVNHRPQFDKPSCASRGSEAIADALETGIAERSLHVQVERKCCLGQCNDGPTLRLAPGGDFLLGVALGDVPAILDRLEAVCGRRPEDREEMVVASPFSA